MYSSKLVSTETVNKKISSEKAVIATGSTVGREKNSFHFTKYLAKIFHNKCVVVVVTLLGRVFVDGWATRGLSKQTNKQTRFLTILWYYCTINLDNTHWRMGTREFGNARDRRSERHAGRCRRSLSLVTMGIILKFGEIVPLTLWRSRVDHSSPRLNASFLAVYRDVMWCVTLHETVFILFYEMKHNI